MTVSPQEEGPKRPLTVVIPASSGGVSARAPIALLRPIMGRPQLSCLLDAARTLSPDSITVFVHGADDKTQNDIQVLMPPGGAVVTGSGDPTALAKTMLEHLRGRPGDVLFIPATAAPLDGALLAGLAAAYRQDPETPCRIGAADGGGEGLTGRPMPMMAGASFTSGIEVSSGDGNKSFVDLVYTLVERAAGGGVREFSVTPDRLPGDVALPRYYAAAVRIVRGAVVERLMDAGVTVIDPERTYVDWGVTVGPGTTLYPDTYLEDRTVVGGDCVIGPSARITDSTLGDEVVVKMCSVITESVVEAGVQIGPFAHIRPKTRLEKGVKIGNFVEVKKSTIGQGSKASHLSYLGDAEIGKEVNVGAGTITCNYDGVKKHTTTIGDGVFIGSDTQFIAPVVVGDDSLIGAGSTITKDVPPNSLAVARSKQVTIPGRGVKSRKEPT